MSLQSLLSALYHVVLLYFFHSIYSSLKLNVYMGTVSFTPPEIKLREDRRQALLGEWSFPPKITHFQQF